MNSTDQLILLVFKKEPMREFSTSEIIRAVYTEEYDPVKAALHRDVDKERKRDAGQKKGELHRRILYHLGKLCQEGILKVTRSTDRGEKVFSLALDPGSYVVEKRERKILIENPVLPEGVDKYHAEGIIRPFEKDTMLSRANAVLIDAKSPLFQKESRLLFAEVNDVLGILHADVLLAESLDRAKETVERILVDARDAGKDVSFLIDLAGKKVCLPEFLAFLCSRGSQVFLRGDVKSLQKNRVLESAIVSAAKHRGQLFVQTCPSPLVFGKEGLYSFDGLEWGTDIHPDVMIMGGMSIEIDIDSFLKRCVPEEWSEVIASAIRSLFLAGRLQRTSGVAPLMDQHWSNEVRCFSRNYIRFFHEGNDARVQGLLIALKRQAKELCQKQEYLYQACGLPLRFRIALGRGNHAEMKEFPIIRKSKDVDDPAVADVVNEHLGREVSVPLYDIFRILRSPLKAVDVSKEVLSLLMRHELPVICIDFSKREGEVSLTRFLGGEASG